MKKQHYKQVWIDGKKENLPEKDGEYIAHSKIYDQIGLWGFEKYTNEFYPDYTKNSWLHNIDWYLQEVEKPELSDAEINLKVISQWIANKIQMPYCWEDIKYRLLKGIKLPVKLEDFIN